MKTIPFRSGVLKNAYTGKEETTLYASFLKENYERSIELIFDIIINANFPEKEIPKEKEVIIDEIQSYRDTPSDLIFDEFDELLFPNQAIGKNILGTEKTIKKFTRKQVLDFVKRNYGPEKAVLSSVGGIKSEDFEKIANRYASTWKAHNNTIHREKPVISKGLSHHLVKGIHQSHLVIGGEGVSLHDKNYTALEQINYYYLFLF